jgi:hypothetical protein
MADTSSDVAGFISDKTATAIQQTWVNGKWVNLADTNQRNNMQTALNKVGKQVEEQQAGIADAQDVASAAMSSASAAIESSKVNSQAIADNSSAVNEAKADAANAFDQAKSAMSAATSNSSAISTLDSSVSSSLSSANDRINAAKSAISANQAAIASAQSVANNAKSASIVATDTASQASVTAVDAKSNALIANQTASQASVTAVNAQSEVNTIRVTASETKAALSNAQGDISALQVSASQASLDIASNSSAVASVTATAKELQTTVSGNSSAISGLKTTMASQATQLSQTASQVALKADQTAVDTLKDTVTANSAAVSVQADEIKQKVTSSDVQGLLNNGGYATQTWTSSQIDLTSNKFSLNLSSLQTQVDNSAVGTNLYTDTRDFNNSIEWHSIGMWTKATETYKGFTVMQSTADWSGLSQFIPVKKGETYTFSLYAKYASGTGTSTIYWLLNNPTEVDGIGNSYSTATASPASNPVTLTDKWQRVTSTTTATSDGYFRPRIERTNNNTNTLQVAGIKVEKGSVATDWCPNPADNASVTSVTNLEATVDGLQTTVSNKVNTTDYNSKMTQLSNLIDSKVSTADYNAEVAVLANDIDLKVAKGNVVSQINQEAGGNTLIQVASGKGKLYLDAATTVFGGTAFISDAMITDLDVNKLNAGTMTGVSSNIGNTYTSLLDSLTRYNVTLDTSGMQTGDVYASDLDYTDYVTVGSLTKSTTNTANTSTTDIADVTSPTLFTIDGSKLSDGDRVLVKLDINYFYDWTHLGTQIVLQSVTDSPVLFSQQPLDYGYYTYSFVITWSTAFGTGKVPFQIKAIGLPPDSNLYSVGANFYTDHGAGTTNYYEAGGALKADGSLHLKDYYSGTASKITDEQYHGYQWDRGTMRLYKYTLEQDNTQTTPVTTIANYETQMDGAGLRFMGNSTDPVLEFFGADVNSLIDSLGQEPWGIDYTGARNLATGIYFDQYGDIHGYPNSKTWKITSYGVDSPAMSVAIDNNMTSPSSWYAPGPLGLRSTGQSTELYMGQKHVIIDNPANSSSTNYDVKLEIKGYIEMTGNVSCLHLYQSSLLSKKTNISELDTTTALYVINHTDIYKYQYKEDIVEQGAQANYHYSPIIDDINATPQYRTPNEFISDDRKARSDGDILGYAVSAIKELSKQVTDLKTQLADLTK